MKRLGVVLASVGSLLGGGVGVGGGASSDLAAQSSLAEAARRARDAWLAHDAQGLVAQSPTLVLQIAGADPSAALGRAQAAELLRRYFRAAEERSLDITAQREVEQGRGFVELERVFVVAGTADLRRETLFLGFRRQGERWVLVELRSAP